MPRSRPHTATSPRSRFDGGKRAESLRLTGRRAPARLTAESRFSEVRQMPLPEWFGSGQNEAAFLRGVLDNVSDCLVVVDTEGRVVLINAPYCRLLGGEPNDFIGRHITEVVSPKTRLHRV